MALSGSRVAPGVIKRSRYWSRMGPKSDMTSTRHRERLLKTAQRSKQSSFRAQECLPGAATRWERQEGSCPRSFSEPVCPANTLLSGFWPPELREETLFIWLHTVFKYLWVNAPEINTGISTYVP